MKKKDEIISFVEKVANRLFNEKDIDHLLSWYGGTLEYLIHVYSYSVGKEFYQTFNTEIPYITGLSNPGTKSNTKWADGAFILKDGIGVLLEVKTIVCKEGKIGSTIKKVPSDMAALLSANWSETVSYPPDKYTDATWWGLRNKIKDPWGVQITLIHGLGVPSDLERNINSLLQAGIIAVKNRIGAGAQWFGVLESCFQKPIFAKKFESNMAGYFFSWAAPIGVHNEAPI